MKVRSIKRRQTLWHRLHRATTRDSRRAAQIRAFFKSLEEVFKETYGPLTETQKEIAEMACKGPLPELTFPPHAVYPVYGRLGYRGIWSGSMALPVTRPQTNGVACEPL